MTDLTQKRYLNRELVLVEVAATSQKRQEIVELMKLLSDAKVVSVQEKSLTIQMTGEQDKIKDFLTLLKPFRIMDISRSGVIAVARGE